MRTDTWALLAVFAAAALYRLWAIERYPPPDAFGFEEFQTGGLAYNTLRNWWSFTLEFPLTNFFPAVSFRLFGLSSFALRAPFLASGIIAPLFLYLALHRVVTRPAAWAAATLLATNRWAAAASRFADEIFFPVSLVAIAGWLFVRVLQERRYMSAFALALISSDFFYAYSGYRGLPFIAFAGTALLAVRRQQGATAGQRTLPLFVLVLSVWAVMLSPGITTSLSADSSLFFEAVRRHGEAWGSQHSLWEHAVTAVVRLRQGWEVFALTGDEVPTLSIPNEAMFDPISAALATLAILGALFQWRDPARHLTLAIVGVPFLALALIPANFNVSRYFVLLVPLFFLTGCFLDDLLRWLGTRGTTVVAAMVVLVAGLNLRGLLRVIDSPVVQAWFQYGENTVLAAIHAVPSGSRVVLLTIDGSNAFEPSDYQWFTAHAHGERPGSLEVALTVPASADEAVYWITQGLPEARLLPKLVTLSCARAKWKVVDAPTPDATVGVSWIEHGSDCGEPRRCGLRGAYRIITAKGGRQEVQQLDPALCAYTIPWQLGWKLQDRQIHGLQVQWEGSVIGPTPGDYQFRLELQGASGLLRVGEWETRAAAPPGTWTSGRLTVRMDTEPLPVSVLVDGQPSASPRVRLYWTPPGAPEEIVPPSQLGCAD